MIHSSYQLDMQIGAFLLILPFIFLYIYTFFDLLSGIKIVLKKNSHKHDKSGLLHMQKTLCE